MYTNEVIVQVDNENRLKVGINHKTRPDHMMSLGAFTIPVGGVNKQFAYQDEYGKKADIMIDGQRTFDMDNPIDAHNVAILRVWKKMYPEISEGLRIIDPNADAEAAFNLEVRRNELITILFDHKDDSDWLANVYRSVIGLASGLTAKVMVTALVEKAKLDVTAFGKKDWVFEGPLFATRAMLLQGVERGIIKREQTDGGEFYRKPDGSVFADSQDKAIYVLQNDAELRSYLQGAVSQPLTATAAASSEKLPDVDPEFAELMNKVATDLPTMTTNPDGSINSAGQEEREKQELKELVGKLVEAQLITYDHNRIYAIDGVPGQTFDNEDEMLGFLKGNPELVKQLKELADV